MATADNCEEDQAMAGLKCASCDKPPVNGKLIRCLHTLCEGCVEPYIKEDNTLHCPSCAAVTPAPGPGKSLLLSLPGAYIPQFTTEPSASGLSSVETVERLETVAAATSVPFCDECDGDEVATIKCEDCSVCYCSIHGSGHIRSKRTKHHICVHISDAATTPYGDIHGRYCMLHTTSTLTTFCKTCKVFLCKTCLTTSTAHSQHTDQLLPISEAAKLAHQQINQLTTDSESSGYDSKFHDILKTTQSAMTELSRKSEAVSNEIEKQFSKLYKAIDRRKDQLLEEAHQNFWRLTIPHEQRVSQVNRSRSRYSRMRGLAANCSDEQDVLRMEPWIQNACEELDEAVETMKSPLPVQHFELKQDFSGLESALKDVGEILTVPTSHTQTPNSGERQCDTFNTQLSHQELRFSDGNRTMTRTTASRYQGACLRRTLSSGEATVRMKLHNGDGGLRVGVCDPSKFTNNGKADQDGQNMFKLDSRDNGHTICLTMNRDTSRLTWRNESTRQMQSKEVSEKSELCFFARSIGPGQSVTILPSS